jgi:uroporphyrinogen-III decarboxylase
MVENELSMRERVLMVLQGEIPRHLPFVTRLETWYTAHQRSRTLPEKFHDMTLDEVYRAVGVGRLKFAVPYKYRLTGLEVHITFNGEELIRLTDPVVENFPGLWDLVPTDRAGTTLTELITPVGRLSLTHVLLEEGVYNSTDPYLKEHLVKNEADLQVVEYILERAEFVPAFEKIKAEEAQLGGAGMLVPLLQRIPFQQVLLEYLGEMDLFYALHDNPPLVRRLLDLLDRQLLNALERLAGLDVPYVEFPDNLHGLMTNPKLFREYCLPAYQKYTDILHRQGKKAGSHTDGDIRLLLGLLAESGLDVCESVSPAPLTSFTFREANQAWRGKPVLWGGFPTPLLEEKTSEAEFQTYLDDLLAAIDQPLILGLVDLFLRHNSIERVAFIAEEVEKMDLIQRLQMAGRRQI